LRLKIKRNKTLKQKHKKEREKMSEHKTIITLTDTKYNVTVSIEDDTDLTAIDVLSNFVGLMKAIGYQEQSVADALDTVAGEYDHLLDEE
jgi:predicted RNase H-related nuclease YkuK (DUF458 family)